MAQPSPLSGGSVDSLGDAATFGVVTVSDRASTGIYEDISGPAILQFFSEAVQSMLTSPPPPLPPPYFLVQVLPLHTVSDFLFTEAFG